MKKRVAFVVITVLSCLAVTGRCAAGRLSSSSSQFVDGRTGDIPVKGRGVNPAHEHDGPQPYFDGDVVRNVTAVASQMAFLRCRVHDLGHKSVSWIRQREVNGLVKPALLTTGSFTYTSDQRFSAAFRSPATHHQPQQQQQQQQQSLVTDTTGLAGNGNAVVPASASDWILHIKYVQLRDAGVYECQVSTEPRITMEFHLKVVESKAQILGPSEVYVKQGSTLSLNCIVTNAEESVAVFWYRDLNVIDEGRHDSVATDVRYDPIGKVMTSNLRVAHIPLTSAGNYTCLPSGTDSASVVVHVINGEHPAAMQHGNNGASCGTVASVATPLTFATAAAAVVVLYATIRFGAR